MRIVHPNRRVAELFAGRATGLPLRNAGKTLYIEGEAIYSYGPHFPIALWADTDDGPVVYFTSRRWTRPDGKVGATTERHKSIVRGLLARFGVRVIDLPDPTADGPAPADFAARLATVPHLAELCGPDFAAAECWMPHMT